MSNIKISQLPDWSGGNTTGSFIVMNDSGSAATYKVRKEAWMFPYNGTANISGSLNLTGSLRIRDTSPMFLSAPSGSGSITFTTKGPTTLTSLNINSVGTGSNDSSIFTIANVASSGQYSDQIQLRKISGSFFFYDSQEIGPSTGVLRTVFEIKSNLSGSSTYSPVEFKRNVEVTGSLKVSGSVKIDSGDNVDLYIQSGSNVAYQTFGTVSNLTYHTLFASGSNGQSILALDNGSGTFSLIKTESQLNIEGANASHKVSIKNNTEVTGSINITNKLNLKSQNPLPAGVLGDLAVSSSNALYFHNGTAWTLIS